MRFSDEQLQGPPNEYGRDLALESVYGITNSYVRNRKARVTLKAVSGQVESARRAGASESEIRARIQKGITDPPNFDRERVREIVQAFLL
jgi:hypothetical protein